ncbi:MAG TPA: 1-deoxy-D-xylulose-5-phosphate reductoisomerase [Quisquiliibacterium sp.]|nr:1-deoxy-D-xylulose-5-phosphate reductoisomerase [Quisquiliibacterium sp.]
MSVPRQRVCVLGSTGSIGTSTLDVIGRHPERFEVFALSAHSRVDDLAALCVRFAPRYAAVPDAEPARRLRALLRAAGCTTEVLDGPDSLAQISAAPEVDAVMAAIVGAAGLAPTLAAARRGKRILLANKEALVMAGPVFVAAARDAGAVVLPIDSEHNAIFQCLPADVQGDARAMPAAGVRRILLTASGGPFRTRPLAQMHTVTPDEACAHPNWSMGRKISVDSATMMNKGLELIEAHLLFGLPQERIEIVVHPQSVIHSMVEYLDGSVLAQLGNPDMRTPIAHALAYPERIASGVGALDLPALGRLDFEPPDPVRFPCLRLAREALAAGAAGPCVLNAANEVAVEAFLAGRIAFPDIAATDEAVLAALGHRPSPADVAGVLALDAEARSLAQSRIERCAR